MFGCAYGFDKSRYEAVLDACALVRDFDILDAGDLTGCFFFPRTSQFLNQPLGRNWRKGYHIVGGTTSEGCSCACDIF